jgi:pyruvate kinase
MKPFEYETLYLTPLDEWKAGRTSLEILCTLGPASLDRRTIQRLEQSGATLFRINLSHTKLLDLPKIIDTIRDATAVPICLDTEGAQIRTGTFVEGSINLRENSTVRVHFRRVPADDRNFNLYPLDIARRLRLGDFLSIDFHSVLAQVVGMDADSVSMRVLQGGPVGQNKAVTLERDISMPPLTEKDLAALKIGTEMGLKHFALSFANRGEDVQLLRESVGANKFVISKIESRQGLQNLEEITCRSDALLIDRGDLSRQVPIELLPKMQKEVIRRAKTLGCRVYVATNLLESMVSMPNPTRAEVNDIYNTLLDGADGLVLAAETAIGKYPIQCASMVSRIMAGFQRSGSDDKQAYHLDAVSLLVGPHGGRLVHREADATDLEGLDSLPQVAIPERDLMDCEQFGFGTYSPLTGFMTQETLESVLETYRLPNGVTWTLPIVLQLSARKVRKFATGDRVALTNDQGTVHALLDVAEIYRSDLESVAAQMFGTDDRRHPGVSRLLRGGDYFVGGDITLVRPLAVPYRHYLLTPAQTRFVFTRLGWSQVVAFHSRNPAHRAHEWIQLAALERTGADGLYINPVIGPKKKGDFLARQFLHVFPLCGSKGSRLHRPLSQEYGL